MMDRELRARREYRVEIPTLDYYRRQINCQFACPVNTDARGYVIAIAEGDFEEAYRIARRPNPLAGVCGRICTALCEDECRRGVIDEPVAIRALKRFAQERGGADQAMEMAPPSGKRVAVIGSGPAGLAAAHDLALLGHQVTIFEAAEAAGGMMRLGIPAYRLPRDLLDREIQATLDLGVELRLNTRLGPDLSLSDLRDQGYEAIFIAIGLHRSREVPIEGLDLDGVLNAVDFLLNVNLGYKVEMGNKVLVIGAGGVAFDVARTALRDLADIEKLSTGEMERLLGTAQDAVRQMAGLGERPVDDLTLAIDTARWALRLGVRDVSMVCLESREEMPADDVEVEEAAEEGIQIYTRRGPRRILGQDGKVVGLETIGVSSVFDSEGRFNPSYIPDTESVLEADTVVMAIGQTADLSFIREEDGIEITQRATIVIDPDTLATTAPGIFAGGDVAFGPRVLIQTVADGRKAARAIDDYLRGKQSRPTWTGDMTVIEPYSMPAGYEKLKLERKVPVLPVERRIGIAEVELGYDEDGAIAQAKRCFQCSVNTIFNGDKCILCGGCVDVCPERCLKMVSLDRIAGDESLARLLEVRYGVSLADFEGKYASAPTLELGTAMIKDDTHCIRCGLCAKRCPTDAITMEAFSFEEQYESV